MAVSLMAVSGIAELFQSRWVDDSFLVPALVAANVEVLPQRCVPNGIVKPAGSTCSSQFCRCGHELSSNRTIHASIVSIVPVARLHSDSSWEGHSFIRSPRTMTLHLAVRESQALAIRSHRGHVKGSCVTLTQLVSCTFRGPSCSRTVILRPALCES